MSKKEWELTSYSNGTATLYHKTCGYYRTINFTWYTKAEIARKLRNEYDCNVGKWFEQGYKSEFEYRCDKGTSLADAILSLNL